MPEALIFEFVGVSGEDYKAINAALGLDPAAGSEGWPAGLLSHTGAEGANNSFLVFEVWDAQASQEHWMASQLGPALGRAGLAEPTRVEWLSVVGHYRP